MKHHSPGLTRRDFLKSTVAVAALPTMIHAAGQGDPFGGFVLGVQSYSFREFDTEQALKRINELGLHHVEFYSKHAPLDSTVAQLQALRRLCRDYAVTPIAFGVQRFSKDHESNRKSFVFGKELGIKHLSADPDPDSFDSLDKLVEEFQISIAIHPHGPSGGGKLHRWYSAETILNAVKDHHPLIGSCLDTGHLIRAEQLGKKLDPASEVRLMGRRNFGLHLKDHDNARKTDVVFGQGVLDVPAVLRALRDVDFKGYISIEYEANPKDPFPDMKACVEQFKQSVRLLG